MFSEIARDGAFAAHFIDEDICLVRSRELLQVKDVLYIKTQSNLQTPLLDSFSREAENMTVSQC